MKVKTNLLSYKDPDTGVYTPIPVVISGENINNKQDKYDGNLKTNDKTVVGAINELHNSNFLTSVPSEYVTDSELNAKGYLTQHQDITGKADKSNAETWTFTLEDGTTVTKKVVLA